MTDEMALAEKDYVPAFMTKGLKKTRGRAMARRQIGARRLNRKTTDTGPFKA